MNCFNCNNLIEGEPIKAEPNRHMTSPNSINYNVPSEKQYYNYYCSNDCRKQTDQARTIFFADLDRNASDSKCFVHEGWEIDQMNRRIRIGHCNITGAQVKVEPMQPGNNSGQPTECYEHFESRYE